jgi:hypothetical protein
LPLDSGGLGEVPDIENHQESPDNEREKLEKRQGELARKLRWRLLWRWRRRSWQGWSLPTWLPWKRS